MSAYTPQQREAAKTFEQAHQARNSLRLAGWTAQRLAQEARERNCTVRISADALLPFGVRIEFVPNTPRHVSSIK